MSQVKSAPWILRFQREQLEVRMLAEPGELVLTWCPEGSPASSEIAPSEVRPTRLGARIAVVRFILPDYAGKGGRYRIRSHDGSTRWFCIASDPEPREAWRFLITSDHQNQPGVLPTLRAIARERPFQGILFPGDLIEIPDDPRSWFGARAAFIDSLAAPVEDLYAKTPAQPLLSTTPIFACPGNHDTSSSRGGTPAERFASVSPDDWDLETFGALFLPDASWYAASIGPLRILSLLVSRRWVRGDHVQRRGPCYEMPGRFIFEPISSGSRQREWIRRQAACYEDGCRNVVLLHHPPFAQGINARPLFGDPVQYRENLIARDLVPLFERWADLVLSGHNHAVNHHTIRGVHYLEISHLAPGKPARDRLPDGSVAPEPMGHPSRFFAAEEEATYFGVLEVTAAGSGRVEIFRVAAGGRGEAAYGFDL